MPRPRTDPHPLQVCSACQHKIVTATTRGGQRLEVDVELESFRLVLNTDNTTYRAELSSAYPLHRCRGRDEAPYPAHLGRGRKE